MFFDFRYTFMDEICDDERARDRIYHNLRELLKDYSIGKMSGGIEFRGKTGDKVKPHCHFRFQSDTSIDAIRRTFTRKCMDKYDDYRRKSHAYYLKLVHVDDPDRWWRYPWKETIGCNRHTKIGFTQEEYDEMNKRAYDQRQISYEVTSAKADKKEAVTFVEKLHHYLDNQVECGDVESTFYGILQFFVDQDKPFSKETIKNHSYLYLVKKKKISFSEFYNM